MLTHLNIRKYNLTSPDGKSHNMIHHIFKRMSSWSPIFKEADCGTNNNLLEKCRQLVSVSKRVTQKYDTERFNIESWMMCKLKKNIMLKSQIILQLLKTWLIVWTSLGKH
jgi:hypothetical protein